MPVRKARIARCYWITRLGGVLLLLLLATGSETLRAAQSHGRYLVYVGTTGTVSKGIYVWRFRPDSGTLTSLGLAADSTNPYTLVASHDGRFLYAANIIKDFRGGNSGAVSAFSVDKQTGKLILLSQVSSRGANPAYISLDKTERFLLVANYGGGSVAVCPVHADGSLGEAVSFVQHQDSGADAAHRRKPHPHEIKVTPDNRFAMVADKGLDKLYLYQFNSTTGSLAPATPAYAEEKPSSGPRHFVFASHGRVVYVVDETGSTVTVFSYNPASAALRLLQVVSALPEGFTGKNTGAEIGLAPNGKFLYSSNRGDDSIAVFAVNARKATVTAIDHVPTQGKTPVMLGINPSGAYMFVANENSDNVVIFRVNQKTGRLIATGQVLNVSSPECVIFVAAP